MSDGEYSGLNDIWGVSGSDVFAVGQQGTVLHYDGVGWTMTHGPSSNRSLDLLGVWGESGNDVFAVGYPGTILHYDGDGWTVLSNPLEGSYTHLSGVWGGAGDNAFVTSDSRAILHYTDVGWGENIPAPEHSLNAVWVDPDGNFFVVGDGGAILSTRDPVETAPEEPILNVSTSESMCSITWSRVARATGYILFFAPYPGVSHVGSVDMGSRTGVSVGLTPGAAYYVAVVSYNNVGQSDLSNIEFFVIEGPGSPLPGGFRRSRGDGLVTFQQASRQEKP